MAPYVRERNSWLKVYAKNGINDPEWSALVNELSSESGKFAYEPVPALYSFYQQHLSRFSGIIYSLPH